MAHLTPLPGVTLPRRPGAGHLSLGLRRVMETCSCGPECLFPFSCECLHYLLRGGQIQLDSYSVPSLGPKEAIWMSSVTPVVSVVIMTGDTLIWRVSALPSLPSDPTATSPASSHMLLIGADCFF